MCEFSAAFYFKNLSTRGEGGAARWVVTMVAMSHSLRHNPLILHDEWCADVTVNEETRACVFALVRGSELPTVQRHCYGNNGGTSSFDI